MVFEFGCDRIVDIVGGNTSEADHIEMLCVPLPRRPFKAKAVRIVQTFGCCQSSSIGGFEDIPGDAVMTVVQVFSNLAAEKGLLENCHCFPGQLVSH